MTLFRQLIIAVLGLFLMLYAGNIAVSLHNTKLLVTEQMQVHAQDMATSLGLSATQAAKAKDLATLETLFNAVSDSGYFERIYFVDLIGNVIIERKFPVSIEGVPGWFIDLIALSPPDSRASVSTGWIQLGEVGVVSHPGQAYLKLWQAIVTQLGWFALVTVMVCLLAYGALKIILNPLRRVEKQADAICEQRFEQQSDLPKPRELKRVVEAMNRMSARLKTMFAEQLDMIDHFREQASVDAVTGLSNRAGFDSHLESFVSPETGSHSAALLILSVSGLSTVNALAGRTEGNALLKAVADQFSGVEELFPGSAAARRQASQYAVFIPDVEQEESEAYAEKLFRQVGMIDSSHEGCELSFNMGYSYQSEITSRVDILREADVALKQAISSGPGQWCRFSQVSGGDAPILGKPANGWRSFIEGCLIENTLTLALQPVFAPDAKQRIGQEVYLRFQNDQDLVSAGVVLPIAERLGLMPQLDAQMISNLIAYDQIEPLQGIVVVNLSISSIQSPQFIDEFGKLLEAHRQFAERLVVEIAEFNMSADSSYIRGLQKLLARYGAGLAIDHFGLKSLAFGYLGSLPLHHLRVHRSFTRQLQNDTDNQFYINALKQLAHNSGMQLWVEGIETPQELDAMQQIGVDALQGHYLGEPQASTVVAG